MFCTRQGNADGQGILQVSISEHLISDFLSGRMGDVEALKAEALLVVRLGDEDFWWKNWSEMCKAPEFFMEIIGKMVGTPLGMGKPE